MPVTQVITSVGGSDSAEFSQPVVFNAGSGAAPLGIDSLRVGNNRVSDPAISGHNIAFDFTLLAAPPPSDNNLFFDDKSVAVTVGTDFSSFGESLVEQPLTFTPASTEHLSFGVVVVKDTAVNGHSINFDFVEVPPTESTGYRNFPFDGINVCVTKGHDSAQVGTPEEVVAPLQIRPTGWEDLKAPNAVLVRNNSYSGWNVEFNFVSLDTNAPHFFFGGVITLAEKGSSSLEFGTAVIENVAQGCTTTGVDHSRYGNAWVTPPGKAVNFNFDRTYTPFGAENVPFYFWSPINLDTTGTDHSTFGDASTAYKMYAQGWYDTVIIQPVVFNGFGPSGFETLGIGVPAVDIFANVVYPNGFNTFEAGQPYINFGAVLPYGFPSTEYGTSSVTHYTRYLVTTGTDFLSIGQPSSGRPISVTGFTTLAFGVPRVRDPSTDTSSITTGDEFTEYGEPTINRRVKPTSIQSSVALGEDGSVTHFFQIAEVPTIYDGATYGTPFVAYRVRYITVPPGMWTTTMGTPSVNYPRAVYPTGINALLFPQPDVDWGNVPRPTGIPSTAVVSTGASLYNADQYALTNTVGDLTQFGGHKVYNLSQFIFHFAELEEYEQIFGTASIKNRNRVISNVGGQDYLRFPFYPAHVENAADAVYVSGFNTFASTVGGGKVELFTRYLQAWGDSKTAVSSAFTVRNAAQDFKPQGFDSSEFAKPVVWNYVKYITRVGNRASTVAFGTPFVAPRVRYLQQKIIERTTVVFGTPWIDYVNRTVVPFGLNSLVHGRTNVLGPFRRELRPQLFGTFEEGTAQYGTPRVKNFNPQAWPYSITELTWGVPWVSYLNRNVTPSAIPPRLQVGKPVIGFKIRRIYPIGSVFTWMTQLNEVRKMGVYTYNQPVYPSSIFWVIESSRIGIPEVRKHPEPYGFESMSFGEPTVWSNNIVVSAYPMFEVLMNVGVPTINKTPEIKPTGIAPPGIPKIQISPHTLWCTYDTPEQAHENHGPLAWEAIDYRFYESLDKPWFGQTTIANKQRTIYTRSNPEPDDDFMVVSDQLKVDCTIKQIRTEGTRFTKWGIATLPHVRTIYAISKEPGYVIPETHRIGPVPLTTQWLKPAGTLMGAFGQTDAQLLNRPIYPLSVSSDFMVFGNNYPMVHFPRVLYQVGHDSMTFGDNAIDFYIRSIYLEGSDHFISQTTPGYYKQKMTVRNKNETPVPTVPDGPVAQGIDTLAFGQAGILLGDQKVYPYMIPPPKCAVGHDGLVEINQ